MKGEKIRLKSSLDFHPTKKDLSLIKNNKNKIWLSPPHMGESEKIYVEKAFSSNWIAPMGPNVVGFEKDIETFMGNGTFAACLSSGTAALHLALKLLGIEQGDVVLCQSFTFAASAYPIFYVGAEPVFIDSEDETWNLSPTLLEEAVLKLISDGKKPKAIIAVHLYGMPYKVKEVNKISRKYDIPVIEDSAEAMGSMYQGMKCGSIGEIGILSFNGNKIITTSGGGALLTKNKLIKERAIFLSTQARDDAPHYQHSQVGYNYRMSNVLAGIGRGQMEVLAQRLATRRKNFTIYRQALSEVQGISFLEEPENVLSNRWLTTILTEDYRMREAIRLALDSHNIDSRPLWKPMHIQPVFADSKAFVNGVSEDLFDRGLCLPSGSNLTDAELEKVIRAIKEVQ